MRRFAPLIDRNIHGSFLRFKYKFCLLREAIPRLLCCGEAPTVQQLVTQCFGRVNQIPSAAPAIDPITAQRDPSEPSTKVIPTVKPPIVIDRLENKSSASFLSDLFIVPYSSLLFGLVLPS
jgi:hypothetical protein